MRVKIKHEAASDLLKMIDHLLVTFPADQGSAAEMLLDTLIKKIKVKIRAKCEGDPKLYHSITLPKEEALAFELWIFQMSGFIEPMSYIYEQNTANQIIALANSVYQKRFKHKGPIKNTKCIE